MIKIKIFNPVAGKNRISFTGFLVMQQMLRDYSIEITESDDFDYAFLGADDILDKSIGLQESIEYGLKNIDKYARGGDCFIFDGSDSTSLMGSYEVLEQSNAMFLFKNQLLKNREDYKTIYNAFTQASRHTNQEPLLVIKMNRKKPLAIIDMEHFFKLQEDE